MLHFSTLAHPRQTAESGFMLVGGAIMVLLISALLSTFAFVNRVSNTQQSNYNAGLRFAELALTAHSMAQRLNYTSGTAYPNFTRINDDINLPDGFNLNHLQADFIVSARESLPSVASFAPATSAMVALHFTGGTRTPTERTSFEAGAAKGGMARMGIVMNMGASVNGEQCRGEDNGARWGPGNFECMTVAEVGEISGTLQDGDVVAPAWETFLTQSGDNILMRYPQPERPELNSMQQNLDMRSAGTEHDITNADLVRGGAVNVVNDMNVANGMLVQGTTTFNGQANMNGQTTVQGPTGAPVLRVTDGGNSTQFANGGGARQRITIAGDTTSISLSATDPISGVDAPMRAQTIQNLDTNTTSIGPQTAQVGPTGVLVQHSGAGPFTGNIVTGNVTIASNVDAPQRVNINGASILKTTGNVYAGTMNAGGATTVTTYGTNVWEVGSIEQRGSGGLLHVPSVDVGIDCRGYACPDRIDEPPVGGL